MRLDGKSNSLQEVCHGNSMVVICQLLIRLDKKGLCKEW